MRILREPLFHFLIIGILIFGTFTLSCAGRRTVSDNVILVSPGKVENLAALFERTWQRPPYPEELEGLINDHLREEVMYREGVAMGLDQNDTVIRRRIRQKLEFVIEDMMRGPRSRRRHSPGIPGRQPGSLPRSPRATVSSRSISAQRSEAKRPCPTQSPCWRSYRKASWRSHPPRPATRSCWNPLTSC